MTPDTNAIAIRMATPDDELELRRLAQLDSASIPAGVLLLAERDGRLQAALSLADGAAIADPFEPTAELLDLLRMRAGRLRPRASYAARMRGALSARRRSRAYAA